VSAVNPRAADTLGSHKGARLGELPIPEPTREAVDAAVQSGSAPDASVDLTKSIELSVGERGRRFLPRVVPIAGQRGAVLVLSDVTDLARMDQMRLELVAVASHELRTPLTTMRMTLSMLQERAAGYAEHERELVATAMVGVEQLSAQVDEYLDLTRIEAGQLKLSWMRLSLEDLVRDVARAIAPACDQAGVKLEVEVTPGVPESIAGDRPRLATVVSNLLSNAIKHTPSGGRIVLRVSPAGDTAATIDVSDSGPGVPTEYRERVFDRFFRVVQPGDSSLASAGVGIGLYIARQVVEAHGGQIRCSAGPLGGASFTVTIPVERPAA
jgi:NtrC-family two-component system sensor histidine kinase KinB